MRGQQWPKNITHYTGLHKTALQHTTAVLAFCEGVSCSVEKFCHTTIYHSTCTTFEAAPDAVPEGARAYLLGVIVLFAGDGSHVKM